MSTSSDGDSQPPGHVAAPHADAQNDHLRTQTDPLPTSHPLPYQIHRRASLAGPNLQSYSEVPWHINATLARSNSLPGIHHPMLHSVPQPSRSLAQSGPALSFPVLYPIPSHFQPQPGPEPALSAVERTFIAGLFQDVVLPRLGPSQVRGWYKHTTVEDRVLVVFRAMHQSGFTLGDFLVAIFGTKFRVHQSIIQTIAAFLQFKTKPGTHPADVVELIFRHSMSQSFAGGIPALPVFSSRPRYAREPSARLTFGSPLPAEASCRASLLDWSLSKILQQVDTEADALKDPAVGLVCGQTQFTWDLVLGFSLSEVQEKIALAAPALFAVMTTIAVNASARSALENAIPASDDESDNDDNITHAEVPPSFHPDPSIEDFMPSPPADSAHTHTKRKTQTPRDPWMATVVAILALLALRYRPANIFPTIIGIFLFMGHSHRLIYLILCRIGLSVSYSSVLRKLHTLAKDSSERLHRWGTTLADGPPSFLIVFDNVNQMRRAWRKTLDNLDDLQSGTAATLIRLEDVPPGAMAAAALEAILAQRPRSTLTVGDLLNDINWDHVRAIGIETLMRIYVKYIPALSRLQPDVERAFADTHLKHRLRLRKSEIETFRCSNIDEATTAGTANVLVDIILNQLRVIPGQLRKVLIFICGDQLSIDRLRKLKRYSEKEECPFARHDWVIPVIQLWHMKWAWQKAIFRLQWCTELGKDVFGLRHDVHILRREKFNHTKCDFYPAHHILQDRFEALALHALRMSCEEVTKRAYGPEVKLTDVLQGYFESAPLSQYSYLQVRALAAQVYDRHMSNAAHDDSRGFAPRPFSIYGSTATAPAAADMLSGSNKFRGDDVLSNNVGFMRTTFWYLEFCAAVAEGDIGRVFEVIKLLRFSFWGAGSTNYGNELLELACNMLKEYPPDMRLAIMNNYLVNPSGRPGHWHELDLLQEHFNFWLKKLFNSKSLDFDSAFLKEAVSLNLRGFSDMRDRFADLFGVGSQSSRHTQANTLADLNALGHHYQVDAVLHFRSSRSQPYQVVNEFATGIDKLAGGQLETFITRTLNDRSDVHLDSAFSPDEVADGGRTQTANPIILQDGVPVLTAFVDANGVHSV